MTNLLARLRFMLKYRSLKRIVADRGNPSKIIVFHKGMEVPLARRCPHQGGPMDEGQIRNGRLHCPWHGCYYELDSKTFCSKTFAP